MKSQTFSQNKTLQKLAETDAFKNIHIIQVAFIMTIVKFHPRYSRLWPSIITFCCETYPYCKLIMVKDIQQLNFNRRSFLFRYTQIPKNCGQYICLSIFFLNNLHCHCIWISVSCLLFSKNEAINLYVIQRTF